MIEKEALPTVRRIIKRIYVASGCRYAPRFYLMGLNVLVEDNQLWGPQCGVSISAREQQAIEQRTFGTRGL